MTENSTQEKWRSSETADGRPSGGLDGQDDPARKGGAAVRAVVGCGRGAGDAAPYHSDIALDTDDCKELLVRGVGQLTRPYGTAPSRPEGGRPLPGKDPRGDHGDG